MRSYRINVENTGDSFACRADENVLRAMAALGHRYIPVGCRGGGCGVCKVLVVRGSYHCQPMSRSHISVEEEKCGHALACKLVPESGLSLRVLGLVQRNILRSKNQAVRRYWQTVCEDHA